LVYTVYPHPSNNKVGAEAYKAKDIEQGEAA